MDVSYFHMCRVKITEHNVTWQKLFCRCHSAKWWNQKHSIQLVLQFNTSGLVPSEQPSTPPHFKYYWFTQKPGFKHRFQTCCRQLDMFKRILCNVILDVWSYHFVTRCALFDRLTKQSCAGIHVKYKLAILLFANTGHFMGNFLC